MGTRNNPGKFDCYSLALPDEPMFILLGRDTLAPDLVQIWAQSRDTLIRNRVCPDSDWEKVEEALKCARDMRVWRSNNEGKWRNPDVPVRVVDLDSHHSDPRTVLLRMSGPPTDTQYKSLYQFLQSWSGQ